MPTIKPANAHAASASWKRRLLPPIDRKVGLHTLGFLLGYVVGHFGITWFGTEILSLGDPKFERGAWSFCWPVWMIVDAPVAMAAILVAWYSPASPRLKVAALWAILFILLHVTAFFFIVNANGRVVFSTHGALIVAELVVLHAQHSRRMEPQR